MGLALLTSEYKKEYKYQILKVGNMSKSLVYSDIVKLNQEYQIRFALFCAKQVESTVNNKAFTNYLSLVEAYLANQATKEQCNVVFDYKDFEHFRSDSRFYSNPMNFLSYLRATILAKDLNESAYKVVSIIYYTSFIFPTKYSKTKILKDQLDQLDYYNDLLTINQIIETSFFLAK